MKPPPLDEAGRVVPHDHEEIANDWVVVRRIHFDWLKQVNDGQISLTTAAFNESSDPPRGMSIDILNLIEADDVNPIEFLTSRPNYPFAVSFKVGDLRALGLQVGFDPLKANQQFPENPFHGEVWGIGDARGKKNSLRSVAQWFVEPENYPWEQV